MNKFLSIATVLLLIMVGCNSKTLKIENDKKGQLKNKFELESNMLKNFPLDSISSTRPRYIQIFKDSLQRRYFTFLNNYMNSIYFYDYNTMEYIMHVNCKNNNIKDEWRIEGYYIRTLDSIYLYNRLLTELLLIDEDSNLKDKISLRGEEDAWWFNKLPQYYPQTVTSFKVMKNNLLFTGQIFESIPNSNIDNFKFTAQVNFRTHKVVFLHKYPKELYGFNYNWEGGRPTTVYSSINSDGNKIIYSFPVSHNIYISELNSNNYQTVYAGSNVAGTISSMCGKPENTTREMIIDYFIQNDLYTAIIYDEYRKVYYRFLLGGIPDAFSRSREKEKPIIVIIMDEEFNYLGECNIGVCGEWYWQNSFITKEGLNIEYIHNNINEEYLTLKIFTLKETLL